MHARNWERFIMTNSDIKEKLKKIVLSSYRAEWRYPQTKYKLKTSERKKHLYSVMYLMDNVQDKYDIANAKENSTNYKYAMFVYDETNEKDSELCIVVGQNPSYSSNVNVDRTNQSIYKALLHNKKTRYLMLNTFPKIDSDGTNSPDLGKTTENIEIAKKLIAELKKCDLTIKLIYACGGSIPVYAKFIEELKKLAEDLEIKTYAFEANNFIQRHMSMQNINSRQLKPSDFSIVKCGVDFVPTDEFKHVEFKKGE